MHGIIIGTVWITTMRLPDFSYEKKCYENDFALIIGVDEVGRGAVAGPVFAGAAALKDNHGDMEAVVSLGINDSKKLTAKRREKLKGEIENHFYVATGETDVSFINQFGIVAAVERAFRQAIMKVYHQAAQDILSSRKSSITLANIQSLKPYLLVDAFNVQQVPGIGPANQEGITKGDTKSISIAAASIIAKVYRDNMMEILSKTHSRYGWEKNKGYGTKDHQNAIREHGICGLHRTLFVRSWV